MLRYFQYTGSIHNEIGKYRQKTTRKMILDIWRVDNWSWDYCLRSDSHQNKTLVRKSCTVARNMYLLSAECNAVSSNVTYVELQCCSQQCTDHSAVVSNECRLLVYCISVVNKMYLLPADFSAALSNVNVLPTDLMSCNQQCICTVCRLQCCSQ